MGGGSDGQSPAMGNGGGLDLGTKRQQYDLLFDEVWRNKQSYEARWKTLADYVLPTRPRWTEADSNKGDRSNNKIIDDTATQSLEIARAGLMAMMASPTRPWFQYALALARAERDVDTNRWLTDFRDRTLDVMERTNFYTSLSLVIEDELVFGTGCMAIFEDARKIIRCHTFPIGSYAIAQNAEFEVDTFCRELTMSVRNVVQRYGWDNCSRQVQEDFGKKRLERPVVIRHLIKPNPLGREDAAMSYDLPWSECIWEKYAGTGEPEKWLREAGYMEFPIIAARWHKNDEDVYGTRSPAINQLGNIKMLQAMVKKRINGLEKQVDPPVQAPSSVRNRAVSLLAGELTLVDVGQGQEGVRPIHEIKLPYQELVDAENQVREAIRQAFMVPLFLMWTSDTRNEPPTAAEVYARDREKLILGPTQERHADDVFDRAIHRIASIMLRRSQPAWAAGVDGLVPMPPDEIDGEEITPEYVSEAAVAQKLVGIGGLERHMAFMGQAMAIWGPPVLDNTDADELAAAHADMLGVTPKAQRSPEERDALRAQRASEAQEAKMVAAAPPLAAAAKDLSETNMSGDSALTRLAGGLQGAI